MAEFLGIAPFQGLILLVYPIRRALPYATDYGLSARFSGLDFIDVSYS
ncbi:MAG: hypothetical protein LBU34_12455 [Planctomycetaceae bacterium]|jgi:hypothetical protein|nr:hypothetical protein [Planctomycetaceae bacterium]